MDAELVRISTFLSLVLRHQPARFGLTLDAHGWAQIDDLIPAAQRAGVARTRDRLEQVVAHHDKQRFALNADGTAMRARHGHSVAVDVELAPLAPPVQLYHGTAERVVPAIGAQGLLPRARLYVHLSADVATAHRVGQRHGRAVVLTGASGALHRDGHHLYRAANGVWLVKAVPVAYLTFPAP